MNLLPTNLKFKYMTIEELSISLDRLSRFKLPEESYFRVFSSILQKCLIEPRYTKTEIDSLPANVLSSLVKKIWNSSVEYLFGKNNDENKINLLKLLVTETFEIIDERTKKLINTNLKINNILNSFNYESAPLNIKFLINVKEAKTKDEMLFLSKKYKLLFPVKKLIIVEGITEEILLPVFAKELGYSFEQNGIYILGAGGKSKSPSLYLKLKDKIKIPILLLFDNDAEEICILLNKNLSKKDKTYLIKNGEFEDILPINLIKRTLNKEYKPATLLTKSELNFSNRMCENIEEFYKTRHLGEYKKSKVSKLIAANIRYKTDTTPEIKEIVDYISKL